MDEHGFHMQHVVNVHVGFLLDAPKTVLQVCVSVCVCVCVREHVGLCVARVLRSAASSAVRDPSRPPP